MEIQEKIFNEVIQSIIEKYPEKSFIAPNKIKESEIIQDMDEYQLRYYLQNKENIRPFEKRAKERRNEDYFGHLDQLNDDYLDGKFADRIHNLRDMSGISKEKNLRKIIETEKYFLEVAKKRNPTAYKLMISAINTIKRKFLVPNE